MTSFVSAGFVRVIRQELTVFPPEDQSEKNPQTDGAEKKWTCMWNAHPRHNQHSDRYDCAGGAARNNQSRHIHVRATFP